VHGVRVLVFDVLGTVVDEVGALRRQAAAAGAADQLTAAWQERLSTLMDAVRSGARPFERQGDLRRRALDDVLAQPAFAGTPPTVAGELAGAGARLTAWPDSAAALDALARDHVLVALSNADLADLTAMSAAAGLRWHAVLSTELVRAFKPAPETYGLVTGLLGVDPAEAMMVAAHPWDLRAAAALGMRTAYVARAGEGRPTDDDHFDVRVRDLAELAEVLR
jgi:2-haloacid dehalogenase